MVSCLRLFVFVVLGFVFACRAQKKSISDDYDEDLVPFLPKYSTNLVAEPQENLDIIETKPVKPSLDFTADNQKSKIIFSKMDTILASYQHIKLAQGYRVQVYFGPSKEDVRRAKEAVYAVLPDVEIHTTYKQPDYRVKIGDFLTKVEAFSCLGKVEKIYPNALIVPDIVNLKK